MSVRLLLKVNKVTDVSEMPCRLNADLHEGSNEIATVPDEDPLNLTYRCEVL